MMKIVLALPAAWKDLGDPRVPILGISGSQNWEVLRDLHSETHQDTWVYLWPVTPTWREGVFDKSPLGNIFIGTSCIPGGTGGKESACQCRKCKRLWFDSWAQKVPWRRAWQATPVFLPEKCHGQRSLGGYSPGCHKESDVTEWLSTQAGF